MRFFSTMRRVWIGVTFAVGALSFYPASMGQVSWWLPWGALALCGVFVLEPLLLTWQVRRRGEELQITDGGVLRRLARGDSESVRWSELREVSIVTTQGVNLSDEYFYVLAGTGTSGVLIGQQLALRHDLLAHLAKLPGFDHRAVQMAMASPVNQRFLLWRAQPIDGEAVVLPVAGVRDESAPKLQ
jgi:hypothetical protein